VTRVVVGRELSVREIAKVAANTHMEVEAFCHGALCVSYSGQCFSSGASAVLRMVNHSVLVMASRSVDIAAHA
jgi:collagenase-like PrtC family protease